MSNTEDNFDEAFKGFGDEPEPVTPPAGTPKEEESEDKSKEEEDAKDDKSTGDKSDDTSESSKEESAPSDSDKSDDKEEESDESKLEESTEPAKPLTKDDVQEVVSNLLNTERSSGKQLESTTQEVLDAYYPDGISNTLVDEKSGKELRTPQDVVDASGGEMSTEEAAQWLLNEQYKLDKQVDNIKNQAKKIAETTVNFKRDAVAAVQKYEPLFKKYPYLQQKVYDKLMKQVEIDEKKSVILKAPDVIEHYDDYLEPYQLAFEHGTQTSATNPAPKEEEPKPKPEDRMDEGGDAGSTPPDDPTDFSQQVKKELAKGI